MVSKLELWYLEKVVDCLEIYLLNMEIKHQKWLIDLSALV